MKRVIAAALGSLLCGLVAGQQRADEPLLPAKATYKLGPDSQVHAGVPAGKVEIAIRGYRVGQRLPFMTALYEEASAYCAARKELLRFAHDSWGRWPFDAERGQLVLQEENDRRIVDELMSRIAELEGRLAEYAVRAQRGDYSIDP